MMKPTIKCLLVAVLLMVNFSACDAKDFAEKKNNLKKLSMMNIASIFKNGHYSHKNNKLSIPKPNPEL